MPPLPWLDMCCLSILRVGRLRGFGLVVVRVAKLVVVALVVVGIDELIGEGGVVHSVGHFTRFAGHARGLHDMVISALGHSVSHESPALVSAPLYMGVLVSHENGVGGANDNYALLL